MVDTQKKNTWWLIERFLIILFFLLWYDLHLSFLIIVQMSSKRYDTLFWFSLLRLYLSIRNVFIAKFSVSWLRCRTTWQNFIWTQRVIRMKWRYLSMAIDIPIVLNNFLFCYLRKSSEYFNESATFMEGKQK